MGTNRVSLVPVAAIASLALCVVAVAEGTHQLTIDVSGTVYEDIHFYDLGGGNEVHITGLAWHVWINAPAPAWYSNPQWGFGDGAATSVQISLNPGVGFPISGPSQLFSQEMQKLEKTGLPDVRLLSGVLKLVRNDNHNNGVIIDPGSSITVQYNIIPSPSALALPLLVLLRGRRRPNSPQRD